MLKELKKDVLLKNQKGTTVVEFAIILPLLLLLIFGIIEFGLFLFNRHVITNAVREAARAGIVVKLGAMKMAQRVPEGARVYVTIDIDGFDPSIAPGTGTPSHGGFLYYEVLEFLQELSKRNTIVGIDLVEVAPDYDPTGSTSTLAAQILLNFLGFIFHNRR